MRPDALSTDPLTRARAVAKPAIGEVLDRDTGEFIGASDWIESHVYAELIDKRVGIVERIDASDPHFVCADCFVPVYVVSRPEDRIFFFKHIREDGSCPAQTRSQLTADEITARKYHGLRESKLHRDIKALIERSLKADGRFSTVLAETTWRSKADPDRYRRPDVQATSLDGQRLAFEVQLSTTFLSVVAGRRAFYRAEGALLIWIFGSFDPAYRRLTTDDLLFSNNSNVFVVDEETALLSEASRRLHLRCIHRAPKIERRQVVDVWHDLVVPFDTLTIDLRGQRLFAFDYAAAKQTLHAELAEFEERQRAISIYIEQQDLFEFWLVHGADFTHKPENRATWTGLRHRFKEHHGIGLPEWPDLDDEIRVMLNAFYSLREGEPVGWRYKHLIEVAHNIAEYHPDLLSAFGFAVKAFGRSKMLADQDRKGRWRARLDGFASALNARNPHFLPDPHVMPLMRFLFPEIAAKVDAFWRPVEEALDSHSGGHDL